MADFYQHARLPTLHHLATPDSSAREAELVELTAARPVALLLPALYAEVERPALPAILQQVADVPYVSEIVLSMNGMTEPQLDGVRALVRQCLDGQKKIRLLWNDGPAIMAVNERLEAAGWGGSHTGKGANIWMGLALLKAAQHRGIVISHDTDILNYSPNMLAKLCYPLAHPRMGYRFAKGYYSRVADRLYGRVTRLLIFPLIQSFQEVMGRQPLLDHLESFRYPLSGEFAGDCDTLAEFNMPSAWGLEIAMLCEVHRQLSTDELCQVDLGFHFEHRHRQLDTGSMEQGLVSAAADVAYCLSSQILRETPEGKFQDILHKVLARYHDRAAEWMKRYEHVALLNGLRYDPAEESLAVAAFTEALHELAANVSDHGLRVPGMRPPPALALTQLQGLGEEILAAAIEL
jgi:glucosyl-3-phosphoglycerate synthase